MTEQIEQDYLSGVVESPDQVVKKFTNIDLAADFVKSFLAPEEIPFAIQSDGLYCFHLTYITRNRGEV
jgi:DNA relaxase NicK